MACWIGFGGAPPEGYLVTGEPEDVASLLNAGQYVRLTLPDDRAVILNRDHVREVMDYAWPDDSPAASIEVFTPTMLVDHG